jgi:transcriptional regulator with XRE-family HTH domain
MSSNLINELKEDKSYREAFVAAHISNGIAFQLRALREAEEWDQKQLAAELGKPSAQPMISRYENPDYGKYSLSSLLELANVFDVALIVKFAPFSELIEQDKKVRSQALRIPTFTQELSSNTLEAPAGLKTDAGFLFQTSTVGNVGVISPTTGEVRTPGRQDLFMTYGTAMPVQELHMDAA